MRQVRMGHDQHRHLEHLLQEVRAAAPPPGCPTPRPARACTTAMRSAWAAARLRSCSTTRTPAPRAARARRSRERQRLVAEVQVGGRLVQQQPGGRRSGRRCPAWRSGVRPGRGRVQVVRPHLGQRPRQADALALAARQGRVHPLRERPGVHVREQAGDDGVVARARRATVVRQAPEQDHLPRRATGTRAPRRDPSPRGAAHAPRATRRPAAGPPS